MTSHDLRDVLNLPSDHAGPRPSKKQRTSISRPNLKGLAREVQNLGGDNPIAIVPEVSIFKKRRLASRKPAARWELRPFANSARGDDGALLLRHWRRKTGDTLPSEQAQEEAPPAADHLASATQRAAALEDSSFARYNVGVVVPEYSEEQYAANLQSDDWSKEETDYLMAMAKDFDLRWALIWDRYEFRPKAAKTEAGETEAGEADSKAVVPVPKARTMEHLKARYYQVAASMMAAQKPAQYMTRPEFEVYEMMQNFKPEQEQKRKEFAINTMSRSQAEAVEEETLLVEIKRILARTDRFNEERRELYQRLDFPATETDINAFRSSAGLQTLLQNLMNVDKSKKRRSLMAPGDAASPAGAALAGSAPLSDTAHHRRESMAAASVSGRRDSLLGAPTTPSEPTAAADRRKKGAPSLERRKLSEQEEQVYGVSYHDRLPSGPTFRYEKINKLYSHKSGQQQTRITNMLCELDIAPRLTMPTAAVTSQFEVLWGAVTSLLDLRKLNDKLDAEIKVEEAKRAERGKARVATQANAAGPGSAVKPQEGSRTSVKKTAEPAVGTSVDVGHDAAAPPPRKAPQGGPSSSTSTATASGNGAPADAVGHRKVAPGSRPGSSGIHKRSASELGTVSDSASKRQKK